MHLTTSDKILQIARYPEKYTEGENTAMFQRFAGFCRRLFSSKGFQRGLRIFLGVFGVYYIYSIVIYLIAVMNTGASFTEALRFFLDLPLFYAGQLSPSVGVALGIAIGLIWYRSRARKSREKSGTDEETEESPDDTREEEIIEAPRSRVR